MFNSTYASVRATPSHAQKHVALVAAALTVAVSGLAHAAGTAAGTTIENAATVSFSIGGTPSSLTSNTSSVTVAEIVDVTIALQSATRAVAPGATSETLVFLVTNTGNGSEAFTLAGSSALGGDDFDPLAASPAIYFDSDSSGDLSPADTPYVAGANDPVLAPDASIRVIVVNDIPAGLTAGGRGRSELAATASTGTGAPGTVFAGQGTGGVDAVVGASGGTARVFGEYVVGDIQISAVKTQRVLDPFGGSRPVPGATITYEVVVTASGTGTALDAAFVDLIPPNTAYVPGSLSLNGGALTDATDTDAGEYATAPSPRVIVALGDLTATAGPQTIAFRVTID